MHQPINLNEYAFRCHLTDSGQMVQWIAALEDKKVGGNLPYWNINGNLGDSAAAQNTPNAQWWLYNWYSSMTGNTVKVDGAASNAAYTLQGLASLDTAKKQARVILAGGGSGASDTVIKNIDPAVFGSTAHVSVFQRVRSRRAATGSWSPPTTIRMGNSTLCLGSCDDCVVWAVKDAFTEKREVRAAEAHALEELGSRDVTFDLARAPWGGEGGGDGVKVTVEAGDQRVQGGQVVRFDPVHPGGEGPGVLVSHHRGEVADVPDGEVQARAAGADLLELCNVGLGEQIRGGHDPADHASGFGKGPDRGRGADGDFGSRLCGFLNGRKYRRMLWMSPVNPCSWISRWRRGT